MTLALDSPELVRDIVSVDNAPVDAVLESNFSKYVEAMKKIDNAAVTRQADADKILRTYEPVSMTQARLASRPNPSRPVADTRDSRNQYGSFYWAIFIALILRK